MKLDSILAVVTMLCFIALIVLQVLEYLFYTA